jgi:hypothetical protein
MKSVKDVTRANERHFAQFQNMMDLVKTINAVDECLAQLQNQMGLLEEVMTAGGKHRAQIQKRCIQ